jgi:hypothetical protein
MKYLIMVMASEESEFRLPQFMVAAPEGEELPPLLSDTISSVVPEEALAHHLTLTKRFYPDAVVWYEEITGS